jgi:hypothetical protein
MQPFLIRAALVCLVSLAFRAASLRMSPRPLSSARQTSSLEGPLGRNTAPYAPRRSLALRAKVQSRPEIEEEEEEEEDEDGDGYEYDDDDEDDDDFTEEELKRANFKEGSMTQNDNEVYAIHIYTY